MDTPDSFLVSVPAQKVAFDDIIGIAGACAESKLPKYFSQSDFVEIIQEDLSGIICTISSTYISL